MRTRTSAVVGKKEDQVQFPVSKKSTSNNRKRKAPTALASEESAKSAKDKNTTDSPADSGYCDESPPHTLNTQLSLSSQLQQNDNQLQHRQHQMQQPLYMKMHLNEATESLVPKHKDDAKHILAASTQAQAVVLEYQSLQESQEQKNKTKEKDFVDRQDSSHYYVNQMDDLRVQHAVEMQALARKYEAAICEIKITASVLAYEQEMNHAAEMTELRAHQQQQEQQQRQEEEEEELYREDFYSSLVKATVMSEDQSSQGKSSSRLTTTLDRAAVDSTAIDRADVDTDTCHPNTAMSTGHQCAAVQEQSIYTSSPGTVHTAPIIPSSTTNNTTTNNNTNNNDNRDDNAAIRAKSTTTTTTSSQTTTANTINLAHPSSRSSSTSSVPLFCPVFMDPYVNDATYNDKQSCTIDRSNSSNSSNSSDNSNNNSNSSSNSDPSVRSIIGDQTGSNISSKSDRLPSCSRDNIDNKDSNSNSNSNRNSSANAVMLRSFSQLLGQIYADHQLALEQQRREKDLLLNELQSLRSLLSPAVSLTVVTEAAPATAIAKEEETREKKEEKAFPPSACASSSNTRNSNISSSNSGDTSFDGGGLKDWMDNNNNNINNSDGDSDNTINNSKIVPALILVKEKGAVALSNKSSAFTDCSSSNQNCNSSNSSITTTVADSATSTKLSPKDNSAYVACQTAAAAIDGIMDIVEATSINPIIHSSVYDDEED